MKVLAAFAFFVLSIAHLVAAPLKVGVTAGPHAIIMEKVKELAKAEGIEIQVIEFNDFILPNIALNDKELDINSYQHLPFLVEQVKSRGYKIKSAGKTILLPLGIYSKTPKHPLGTRAIYAPTGETLICCKKVEPPKNNKQC